MHTSLSFKKNMFQNILIVFLVSLIPLSAAEPEKSSEIAYIDNLVMRAKYLETIMKGGNYGKFKDFFAAKKGMPHESILWIEEINIPKQETPNPALEEAQNYRIRITDRYNGSSWTLNEVTILFYTKLNNIGNDLIMATYTDRGVLPGLRSGWIAFRRNGSPYLCEITVEWEIINNGVSTPAREAKIEWDEQGKITKQENLHFMKELNLNKKFPKGNTHKEPPKLLPKKKYLFPKSKYKEVAEVFQRLKTLYSAQRAEELVDALHWQFMDKTALMSNGAMYLAPDNTCIAFSTKKEKKLQGYLLSMDNNGTIISYAEGIFVGSDIESAKHAGLLESIIVGLSRGWVDEILWTRDLSKHLQNGIYWALDYPVVLSRGVEIKYYENGRPKSYHTLVRKDRLFGRQIEWDDKGNVVSDVDLDIPKEIK